MKLDCLEKVDIFTTFHNNLNGFGLKIYINICKASHCGVADYFAMLCLEIMLESTKTMFV